jgi:hypothetical protein
MTATDAGTGPEFPATPVARSRRGPRTATVLRWVHLLSALLISYYFMFKPDGGWPDSFELFMAQNLVPFVAWTGLLKWQLPRLRRWRARRSAAKRSAIPRR